MDVNYVIDEQFRLCFNLKDQNSQNKDFYGNKSGQLYKYYGGRGGYKRSGSYCKIIKLIPKESQFDISIKDFLNDQIIGDRMQEFSIEFVSAEASQDIHAYTSIHFQFYDVGSVELDLYIFTMRLGLYNTRTDYARCTFEIIYLILLAYNIVLYGRKLREKLNSYKKWQILEVDSLT